LSFLLDRSIEFGKINSLVQNLDLDELADFRLIDLYQGPNLSQEKYSLTVRLTFFSPNRTLTQEEVNECCEKVTEALNRSFEIELR
jgi:phenylalanyl-tRNA synthetase beta chain